MMYVTVKEQQKQLGLYIVYYLHLLFLTFEEWGAETQRAIKDRVTERGILPKGRNSLSYLLCN